MTSWLTLAISLTALAASAVALVTVRSRWRAYARFSRSLGESIGRLAIAMAELDDGLDRLSGETRLSVALDELGEASGLEDALARVADAAALVSGAQSAVARAVGADGRVVVGATHPTPNVAPASEIDWPPTGARAMTFTFLHDRDAGEPRTGSGIALPICDHTGAPVALLSVLFDEPGRAARAVAELESLAARAGPVVTALLGARRPKPSHERDELTGLAARDALYEALAGETARARRQGTPLTVVVVAPGESPDGDERVSRADIDAALVLLARCVERLLPQGAAACRAGSAELALVLPGTGRRDAEILLAALEAEWSRHDHAGGGIALTSGAAELMLSDDAASLLERAAKSLQAARAHSSRAPDSGVHGAHEQR